MFKWRPSSKPSQLDKAIDKLHVELSAMHGDDPSYAKTVDQLTKLEAIKNAPSSRRLSPDTLAIIAGNVAVTAMIVEIERIGIVASKAKDYWMKPRT